MKLQRLYLLSRRRNKVPIKPNNHSLLEMKQPSLLMVVALFEAFILIVIWISWMTKSDTVTADRHSVVLTSPPLPPTPTLTSPKTSEEQSKALQRPFFPTKFLDREEVCLDILTRKPSSLLPSNPPNKELPPDLKHLFLLDGRIALSSYYVNDNSKRYPHDEQTIEKWIKLAKEENFSASTYGTELDSWLFQALKDYPIQGKSVIILGSQRPWFEAVALAFGASKVTTLEYNKIDYTHPKITTITNQEYFQNGNLRDREQFDVAFSMSSYEHDGLGRYGDPIDPYGDLKAMLSVKCIIKEHGRLYLSLPHGEDKLEYNAHRIYGKWRTPMLLNRWNVLQTYGIGKVFQPVWVLENSAFMTEGTPGEPFVESS